MRSSQCRCIVCDRAEATCTGLVRRSHNWPADTTQSPETHQLQQTLQNNVNEQARMCGSSNNSGDGASVFSTVNANNTSVVVETVQETDSNNGQDDVDLGNNVRVGFSARLSKASNDADSVCESRLQGLVIDTNDQGQANFALTVGALRNVSGTPLDGSQDMCFGESTVAEFTIDRDE